MFSWIDDCYEVLLFLQTSYAGWNKLKIKRKQILIIVQQCPESLFTQYIDI